MCAMLHHSLLQDFSYVIPLAVWLQHLTDGIEFQCHVGGWMTEIL